jgi:stage II sporulation protein P
MLISLKSVKAVSKLNKDNSLFFVQLINYTMPIIQENSFDSEDLAEKNKAFKSEVWNKFGVDINNPISYISLEAAIFSFNIKDAEISEDKEKDILPFQLSEASIAKQDTGNSTSVAVPDANKPQILIYHSHTTESYIPKADNSTDENYNVCAVGDVLEKELKEKYGVLAIHDKTIHDALGDIAAYGKSRVTLQKYLTQYGDFKLIIDIHRDSSVNRNNDIVTINGETAAKAMFVMCLKNPHADTNLYAANKIIELGNKSYPNLFKAIYPYNTGTLFFNQDLSNNAVLLEVGTNKNSVNEAKVTAKNLAKIIADYIKDK